MINEKIKIMLKRVNKKGQVVEIDNELSIMQKLVGGYIETLFLTKKIVMVLNEDGKNMSLKPNLKMEEINDLIVGDVFFVGINNDGDFESLNEEQLNQVADFIKKHQIIWLSDNFCLI